MKLNLILTSVLTFLIVITQAQQRSCATMDVYQSQIENNSNFLIKQQNLEQMTEYYNNMLPLMNNSEEVYTIPVVIHVLYKTSSENISDEQVYSQMTSLNDDFRALNNDLSSLPSNFEPLVSDMQIEFCLAQVDPNGNSTSGINRVSTNQNSFSYNNNMKFSSSGGVDAWDTDSYLNIWVCSLNNLLGYAQFPGGDASTDGVVVANTAFGSTGIAQAPYDLGRTLTHEIGHWLNLRHIWGDSNCGNDLVDDTPTHQEANYGCPNYPQESCNNGPDGDLFMNYMDYTNDACMYMFTTGQRTRMTSALLNSRSSLLNSTACSIGAIVGCTDPNAANYNPDATQDDNSCEYPCLANEVTLNILSDCYPEETSWELLDQDGILLEASTDYSDLSQTQIIESFCLEDGCYTLKMMDSYGDGLNGSIWSCNTDGDYSMTDADNNILFEMQEVDFGNSITHEFCFSSAPIFGCTDATADNFNPEATQEDLSCTYCDNFSSVLISSNDATSDNPSGGSIQATG
ncbi:MAG: M43 family zinc metalloprotease, partial [Flavobacteriales bacterium]